MQDLTISKGWFKGDKEIEETPVLKKLCEHKANINSGCVIRKEWNSS